MRSRLAGLRALPNDLWQGIALWAAIFGVFAIGHASDLVNARLQGDEWASPVVELVLVALLPIEVAVVILVVALRRPVVALGVAVAPVEVVLGWGLLLADQGPIDVPSVRPPLATLCGLIVVISAPWLWSALPRARATLAGLPMQPDEGAVAG
ncbi:hypothetical protein [Kineosporia sp. NBRC 101731]|uniref:hypothetical protein n=1 Tax=Kineosporia sp. NBRC 101731 TaxID=3032199 RepID=UPI0025532AB2|nr:hypothetical protein [Kineosporia sp. NBRC 101731]